MTSADVDWMESRIDSGSEGRPRLTLVFAPVASERMAAHTRENIGSYLGLAIDDRVISSPRIVEPIDTGAMMIEPGVAQNLDFGPIEACVGG